MIVQNAMEMCKLLASVAKVPHRFSLTESRGQLAVHNEEAESVAFTKVVFPRKSEVREIDVVFDSHLPIAIDKLMRLASMTVDDANRPLLKYIWEKDGLLRAGCETHEGYIDLCFEGTPAVWLGEGQGLDPAGLAWEGSSFPKEAIPSALTETELCIMPYHDEIRCLKLTKERCPFPSFDVSIPMGEIGVVSGKEFAALFKGSVMAERPLVTFEVAGSELSLTFKTYCQAMNVLDMDDFEGHYNGEALYKLSKRASKDKEIQLCELGNGILFKHETDLSPVEIIYPCVLDSCLPDPEENAMPF